MNYFLRFSAVIFLFTIIVGCDSGPQITEIQGWDTYSDSYNKMEVKYPKNWYVAQKMPGQRFLVFSTQNALTRFKDYATTGPAGVKIEAVTIELEEGQTIDSVIQGKKLFASSVYSAPAPAKLGNNDAFKVTYSFELTDGLFNGETYYAQNDPGTVTVLTFETFAGTEKEYAKAFEEIKSGIKLAQTPVEEVADTQFVAEEAEPPTMNMKNMSGEGFTIGIPDNFAPERVKSPDAIKTYNYMGARRGDCYIRVDLLDGSKQKELKKIVEENKDKYKSTPRSTKVGGLDAFVMDYKASGTVKGRVWFAKKGEKLFRVTLNWFTGEEKEFLPAFEKSISTLKFN